MKNYNLYVDESCHLENDGHLFMLMAYTKVLNNKKNSHRELLKKLRKEHHFRGEIKWNKVSSSKKAFYLALVDYFFETDLSFRAVVIKKAEIKNGAEINFEEFYYDMYTRLIYHKLDLTGSYNIYNDIMDTRGGLRIKKLRNIFKTQFLNINEFKNIHSRENVFLQITDFMMGAVSYYLRGGKKVTAKNEIISKIEQNAKHDLKKSTPTHTGKFDLYHIELGK